MKSNQSYLKLNETKYLELNSYSCTLEELQILLNARGVCKELCTHPVVISLLYQLLSQFNHLSHDQINQLLDDMISVSKVNRSFSIVFRKPYNEKIFSYQLEDDKLIYTKQVFTENICKVFTKYFDQSGKKICELNRDVYKIDPILPNDYYPSKKEGTLSL